jgi:serine/threonine-protein kinase
VVILAALLLTSSARADTTRSASMQAEVLFQQGRALRAAGLDSLACAAFEASRRLEEGVGVTLYLADCYESVGETARARSEFTRAELLAVSRGDPRWQVARRRVDALDPPHSAAPAASQIPREGTEPAPPATAPRVSPPPPDLPPKEPDAKAVGPLYVPPEAHSGGGDARRWIGIGLAGAGVVGLAVGTAFGAVAISDVNESNQGPCGADERCTSAGLALRQQAVEAARVSTLGFIAGGAALATGIALCVTAPRSDVKAAIVTAPATGGALAAIAGRF